MAHDKVYGICENKCMVEVRPKSKVLESRILLDSEDQNYIFQKNNFVANEVTFLDITLDEDGDYSTHAVSIEKGFRCAYNICISAGASGNGQVIAGYFDDTDDPMTIYTDTTGRREIHITGYIIRR